MRVESRDVSAPISSRAAARASQSTINLPTSNVHRPPSHQYRRTQSPRGRAPEVSLTSQDCKSRLAELEGQMAEPDFWVEQGARATTRRGSLAASRKRSIRSSRSSGRSKTCPFSSNSPRRNPATPQQRRTEVDKEHAAIVKGLEDFELKMLSQRPARPLQRLPHHPLRRGRHRVVRLGRHAPAHVSALDRAPRLQEPDRWTSSSATKPASSRCTLQVTGEYAYGYLADRARRPPARAHLAVRLQQAPAHVLRQRRRRARAARERADRDQRGRHRSGHLPLRRQRRAEREQSRDRRPHSPHAHAASSPPARPSAASGRTTRPRCACSRRNFYQIETDKKRAEIDAAYGEKGDVALGSQIRSYVFQPYQIVKDLRTGVETSNIAGGHGRRHRRLHPGQTARPRKREGRGRRLE